MIESYTSTETITRAAEAATRDFCTCAECRAATEGADMNRAIVSQRRAAANRLVKAAKSPTDPEIDRRLAKFWEQERSPFPKRPRFVDEAPHWSRDTETPGTWAVIERRDWCGEYRIRMETRAANGDLPPEQEGDRVTDMLTERGARKISESCYYTACQRGGFTTFLTLTLGQEARDKLAKRIPQPAGQQTDEGFTTYRPELEAPKPKGRPLGPVFDGERQNARANEAATVAAEYTPLHETTGRPYTPLRYVWAWSVQREASRFFEAIGKMYRRGWQYEDDNGQPVKLPGSRALYCVEGEDEDKRTGARFTRLKWWREPLDYLWVAENPDRIDEETGEYLGENPHIHVMMRWRVLFQHFQAWAARLEKLWGQGMAHLEKIKEPSKAGAYVAKAAGYLCKAQGKSDQGEIRGNRYGISKRARAPGWIECERHQVGMMGWLLAEKNEQWNNDHGEKIQRRERLKKKLNGGTVQTRAGKVVQILAETNPAKRREIGQELEKVRAEIEPLPKHSKYGAIFKSEGQLSDFLAWARGEGWTEKPQCSQWLHQWRREQLRRRNGSRLMARGVDWSQWFALADAGAVACNDEEGEVDYGLDMVWPVLDAEAGIDKRERLAG